MVNLPRFRRTLVKKTSTIAPDTAYEDVVLEYNVAIGFWKVLSISDSKSMYAVRFGKDCEQWLKIRGFVRYE